VSEEATLPETVAALEAAGLDKWFGGTHALRAVSLGIVAGEVHAIVGENGAGKSTLVGIFAGVHRASSYSGHVAVDGERLEFSSVSHAERKGVFLVAQELSVIPALTVADNLFLGHEHASHGVIDTRRLWVETAIWLRSFGLTLDPTTTMRRLSAGQQQLVRIAHAMARGVKVLILDEPTASLTDVETDLLFHRIAEFKERGVTTLYISHRIAEIPRVADRVTIMRDGRVIETLDVSDPGTTVSRIIRTMVGRDILELYPSRPSNHGDLAFAVDGLTAQSHVTGRPPAIEDVSLSLRRGEILGVFGAVGSGTSVLARALFGAWKGRVSGSFSVNGEPIAIRSPRDAIRAGLGYVSEDRKRTGLIPRMSVGSNLSLVALDRFTRFQQINRGAELRSVAGFMTELRIKAGSVDQPVTTLSGGNQQKVVAAKWLAVDSKILILEEPTHGIDVGAKAEMYRLMANLASEGRAVILVSSDLQEILGMADRVIAIYKGRVAGRWDNGPNIEGAISAAAYGGHADV
jgi:ABC-type sugar transport system ATPase subunit